MFVFEGFLKKEEFFFMFIDLNVVVNNIDLYNIILVGQELKREKLFFISKCVGKFLFY